MKRALLLGIAPLLMAHRCGPTPEQAGAAVLISVPAVFAAVGILLLILSALQHWLFGPLASDWRRWWQAFGISVVVGVVALITGPAGSWEWSGIAVLLFGAFVVVYSLLLWRFTRGPANRIWLIPVGVTLVAAIPVVPLLTGSNLDVLAIWGYGSGVMWGAPAVFVLLLLEVGIRAARKP